MSKHIPVDLDGREILKLTEWELANFHLPPVTTVTLYEGAAPIEFLRQRKAMILEKNTWITALIRQSIHSADGGFRAHIV
jgi:hypothetical protein